MQNYDDMDEEQVPLLPMEDVFLRERQARGETSVQANSDDTRPDEHRGSSDPTAPGDSDAYDAETHSSPDGDTHHLSGDLLERIGPVFLVDPQLCLPYWGSPRAGIDYDEARDFELRQDVLAHGVIEPIIVGEKDSPYPILSGNRRHAVVTQLLSEGMAISLPARVARFSPQETVAFAAAQNVGRLAPTPMQQARSIAWTLEHVEPSQARVAEALGIAESKVSRLALLATLPDWVLTIVTDPETLSENFAGQLQRGLGSPAMAKTMEKRSDRLVAMGRTLPGPAAARYLTTGTLDAAAADLVDRQGTRHATAQEDRRGGFTVRIPPGFRRPGMDIDAVHMLISDWLLDLMKKSAAKAK